MSVNQLKTLQISTQKKGQGTSILSYRGEANS